MSLIADALRKAETQRTTTSPAEPRAPSRWPYRILWALCTAVVLTGWVVVAHRSGSKSSRPGLRASDARTTTVARENPSALLFMAERQISLNGIVTGAGRPLALIDNRLVEEGEMVRDRKLVRILADQVEMEKEGRVTTLKLKN